MNIIKNYQKVREEISKEVTIVAAVKTRTSKEVLEAIEAGVQDIGENYVQEAEKIQEELGVEAKKVRWHLIGHLQSNKIKRALKIFDVIQTVDSYEKAKKINQLVPEVGKKEIEIYLQINISGEESKSGFKLTEDFKELVQKISQLKNLKLDGIMVIGKKGEERNNFQEVKKLFDQINSLIPINTLSMGMTDSYQLAIEKGSSMVRVGTALFGERD